MGEYFRVCFVPSLVCYPVLILRSLVIYRYFDLDLSYLFSSLKRRLLLLSMYSLSVFILPKVYHYSVYSISPLSISPSFNFLLFSVVYILYFLFSSMFLLLLLSSVSDECFKLSHFFTICFI